MSFFIANAFADGEAANSAAAGSWVNLALMGGAFAFMYFIMIRPQRKRQKEVEALLASLGKGDEVVLNSGMLGKVIELDGSYVTLEVGDNVKLKFQKQAVVAVLPKGTIKSI